MENTTGWIDFVPDGWNIMNFGQVIERISTGLNPRDNFKLTKTDKRYYVTIKNFKDGKLYLDDKCDRISENAWEVIQERSDLHKGDILLASISKEGQVYLLKEEPNNWNVNESVFCIRVNKRCMNNRYFCYEITNVRYYDDLLMDATGTTFKSIKQNNLKQSRLLVPPLSEQQAIADYLDETCSKIDEIIAEAKASIDEYKELKQSVITEAVLHGFEEKSVKHSSIEWIGDYNAEFGMTRIGRFCFVTKLAGFEYTNAMADSIVNEFGVPIVRAQNVKMFKFYSDKIGEFIPKDISFQLNRSSLNKKCLLITFIGAGIGDVCVFDEKERYHLAPNVAKIEIFDEYKCLLDEHYLMYYLGSEAGQGEIRRISKASAQPSLSMETIRSINVVLPPFDVQEQIVEYLNKKMLHMDSLIAEKQSLIADLEAYKKSLIYEVVTGKRRVV